jgi:serine/threonine-protein kinase
MIRLSLLGSLDLRASDGRQILSVLAQPKRVALLAYLATNRDYVRRDTLLGLFWPESDEEHARHALRQSVYTLRRGLGPRALASRGDEELAVDCEHLECDVAAFESAVRDGRAEAALELYKGDLLEGFFLSDAPEFEKWLDGRRTTLRNQAAEAAWAIAQAAEAAANGAEAAEWARRAAEYAPDEESTVQRLVGLLDRVGDRAAALRAYEAFAWRLENELGLQPSPETQALVAEIRARQEAAPHSGDDKASRARAQPVDGEWSLPDESLLEGAPKATAEFELAAAEVSGELGATRVTSATAERTGSAKAISAVEAATPDGEPKKHRVLLGIAVAALAVAAVIVDFAEIVQWTASRFYGDESAAFQPPMEVSVADLDPRRIAVLYFDDISEGQDLKYLAAGLTDGLIQRLSQVRGLEVISRNGVRPYQRGNVTIDSIVRALTPGTIVEGSVISSGGLIRVNVQLIDATSNAPFGSRTLNRSRSDILSLLDDLSTEVSFFLRDRLGGEIRVRELQEGTESLEAWTLFQKAEVLVDDANWLRADGDAVGAGQAYGSADSLLAETEAADPKWLTPVVARGWVAANQARREGGSPADFDRVWIDAGIEHANRALELAPLHPQGLELRGKLYAWIALGGDTEDGGAALGLAYKDLQAAVAEDNTLARAWATLAELYIHEARFPEARVAIGRALEADAFLDEAQRIYMLAGLAALNLEEFEEALFWTDEGFKRFADRRGFAGLRLLLLSSPDLIAESSIEQAWEAVHLLEQVEPPEKWPSQWMKMATVLAAAGLQDSARSVIRRARAEEVDDPFVQYYEAKAWLSLGERGEAVRLLGIFLAARPDMKPYLRGDWWWRPLDKDSTFQSLIAEEI